MVRRPAVVRNRTVLRQPPVALGHRGHVDRDGDPALHRPAAALLAASAPRRTSSTASPRRASGSCWRSASTSSSGWPACWTSATPRSSPSAPTRTPTAPRRSRTTTSRSGRCSWSAPPSRRCSACCSGAPTLRLRGDYLAIVTLGFGEIVPVVFNNSDTYTNGTNGITALYQPGRSAAIARQLRLRQPGCRTT